VAERALGFWQAWRQLDAVLEGGDGFRETPELAQGPRAVEVQAGALGFALKSPLVTLQCVAGAALPAKCDAALFERCGRLGVMAMLVVRGRDGMLAQGALPHAREVDARNGDCRRE
ncbi:MAG: hypothetical protein RL385_5812, partial [Pseudomonadota bacterium]